jgi:microcystin-dependent protein
MTSALFEKLKYNTMKTKILSLSIMLLITAYSFAQVGVNVASPTKMLDVNGELRVRTLPDGNTSQLILASDNDGNLYKVNIPQKLPEIGDIKDSYQTSDHAGWYLLNGRAITSLSATAQANAATLGFSANIPNFTDRYSKTASMVSSIGVASGSSSYTLTQANMPSFTLSGTTSTNGAHTHTATDNVAGRWYGGEGLRGFSGPAVELWVTQTTSTSANHTHSLTLNSNGGGQAISLAPAYIALNAFVYLGI